MAMSKENWVETTLDQVVLSRKGKKPVTLKVEEFKKSLPYIDIEAFETGKIKQYADYESSNHCEKTDVLVVWDGARFGLTGTNQVGAIGSTLACLKPVLIESCYVHKFIQRHYGTIQQKPKGMATPHVDPEVFWNLEFPLPPLGEQKRIVAKLDTILPKVKDAKARLEKIPSVLKKFKQSILAAACSGRLTEDIRKDDEYVNDDIPSSWIECFLPEVLQSKPKNGYSGKPVKYETNTKVLSLTATTSGVFKSIFFKYLDEVIPNESSCWIKKDDILIQRGNTLEYVGVPAIYKGEDDKFIYPDLMIRLVANKKKLQPDYLYYYLSWEKVRNYMRDKASGTAGSMPKINQGVLEKLVVFLPSLEEQKEIVKRVEKLFKVADSIEAKYKKAMERVNKIEQSVLAKAFRGELVEPDPNDEPAVELLKRILDEKTKLQDSRSQRRKKRKLAFK